MSADANIDKNSGIAFVIHGFSMGGAERVAATLISSWVAAGRQVELITIVGTDDDVTDIAPDVPRSVLGDAGRARTKVGGIFRNIAFLRRLRRALRRSEASTVVSFLTNMNIRTILASRGLRKRVIISERNDTSRQPHPRAWAWLRRRVYRYADVVTANSRVALEDMHAYVPEAKLALIPNPVTMPGDLASSSRSTTILCVGRLQPQKRHRLVIEALALLGNAAESWDLTILGEGPEREALWRLATEGGVASRCHLPGFEPSPTAYYRQASIFVLPSEYEGTPGALLEAMAHGLPCVVSDSLPGALEYVEDDVTGLVFREDDPADLATKLRRLVMDPELRTRLGTAARSRIENLRLDRVLETWDQLLATG